MKHRNALLSPTSLSECWFPFPHRLGLPSPLLPPRQRSGRTGRARAEPWWGSGGSASRQAEASSRSTAAEPPYPRRRPRPGSPLRALRTERHPPPLGAASAGEEPSGRSLALGPGRAEPRPLPSPIRHSPPGRAFPLLPPPQLPPPLPARRGGAQRGRRGWREAAPGAGAAPGAAGGERGLAAGRTPPDIGNMAASSRAQVLRLYRALLRESQRFSSYNYRCAAGPGGDGFWGRAATPAPLLPAKAWG